MFGRRSKSRTSSQTLTPSDENNNSNDASPYEPTKAQLKRATRTRRMFALLTSFLLLISLVFLILVEIGDTRVNPTLNKIYFIRLDLSDIIPVSVPNSNLINSIAQTLGLHDFYTVGLWGYCQGYNGQGTTECSDPQTLYWFNPIEIIQSQLLAGATIALPAQIDQILSLIRLASNWMFGLFLAGAVVTFIMIFIVPLAVYSRWASLPITIFTFLAALMTTVATVVATVMFIIMQNAVTSRTEINIGASLGIHMFAFMWIAAGTAILAFVVQLGLCCCCASRRDVKTGRKRGSKRAWSEGWNPAMREKGRDRSPGRINGSD